MDREKAIKAVADFLTAVGEDVTREGLKDTPARVADMYAELLAGNGDDAAKHLSKTFAVQSGNTTTPLNASIGITTLSIFTSLSPRIRSRGKFNMPLLLKMLGFYLKPKLAFGASLRRPSPTYFLFSSLYKHHKTSLCLLNAAI